MRKQKGARLSKRLLACVLALVMIATGVSWTPKKVEAANEKVEKILEFANSKLYSPDYSGACQAFVKACYEYAGIYASTNAKSATEAKQRWMVSNDLNNIPIGACVYFTNNHVAIYMGNDQIIHTASGWYKQGDPNISYVVITSLSFYINKGTAECWGYQAGYDLYGSSTDPIDSTNYTSSFPLVDGGIYKIVSALSGKVIEVSDGNTANGKQLTLWTYSGSPAWMQWKAVKQSDGYSFLNMSTGKAIDIVGGSKAEGTKVTQYDYIASDAQRFKLVDKGSEKYGMIAVCSNLAIDVYGSNTNEGAILNQYKFHGGDNQLWKFERVDQSTPIDTEAPIISNISVFDLDSTGYTVSCTVTDNVGLDAVAFPTWTYANGQDDITSPWPHCTSQSGDTYIYRVNISDHNNEAGAYTTQIWACDTAGNYAEPEVVDVGVPKPVPADTEPPVISDVKVIAVDCTGYTVSCTVTDNVGLDAVAFPTWTYANGRDDMASPWPHCTSQSGDTYTYRVDVSDHNNEAGAYTTRIWACDTAGNYAEPKTVDVEVPKPVPADTEPPVISDVKIIAVDCTGYTVSCTVTDNVGLDAVAFPTWTYANGQDDMASPWPHCTSQSGDTYIYRVDISDHNNEAGAYTTQIWACDTAGNYAEPKVVDVEVPEAAPADTEPPVISDIKIVSQDSKGYTIACAVTDNVGVTRVAFSARTDADRQNGTAAVWQDYTKYEDGYYFHEVKISDHNNEMGRYKTYIYAYDAAGNYVTKEKTTEITSDYAIVYNANGGTGAPETQTKKMGEDLTLSTVEPTRTDYDFIGWNTEADGNGTDYAPGAAYAADVDMILYAQWKENGSSKYTVTYDLQGHGAEIKGLTVDKDSKLTKPADPIAEGYVFGGWFKEAQCETAWDFDSDKVTQNTTLYAKWTKKSDVFGGDVSGGGQETKPVEKTYTVTYDLQGHGEAINPITVKEGGKAMAPASPKEEGFTFGGWYKEAACKTAWDFDVDTVTADTTLYAKWTEVKVTVTPEDVDNPYYGNNRKSMKSVKAQIGEVKSKVYDGKPYLPIVKVSAVLEGKNVTLTEGTDYRVLYWNNVNAGTGKVIVKGNGIYDGEITADFVIAKKPISKLKVVTGGMGLHSKTKPAVYVYDGSKLLTEGEDYKLSGTDGLTASAGKKDVTITATEKGNYEGSRSVKVTVYNTEEVINDKDVELEYIVKDYSGKALKPRVSVKYDGKKLDQKYYSVKYENNKEVGTAYVTVTGRKGYGGCVVKTFEIKPVMKKFTLKTPIREVTYNGKLQKPKATVMVDGRLLKQGKDYLLLYSNNIHATKNGSKAKITVKGLGNYEGIPDGKFDFTITSQKIGRVSVKGTKENLTLSYVKKELKLGTDYEVKFGAEDKGKVEVTITGKGDFTDSVTKKVKSN